MATIQISLKRKYAKCSKKRNAFCLAKAMASTVCQFMTRTLIRKRTVAPVSKSSIPKGTTPCSVAKFRCMNNFFKCDHCIQVVSIDLAVEFTSVEVPANVSAI